MATCIFCRIVERRAPAHVVWSDAEHVAFLDTHPITAGHAARHRRRRTHSRKPLGD